MSGKRTVTLEGASAPYAQRLSTGHHTLTADEPRDLGGQSLGPDPYEFVLMGLSACTAITVRMYAQRKEWPLADVKITATHEKDEAKNDVFTVFIRFEGGLDDEQRARLLEIAGKCPVHKTLKGGAAVKVEAA